MAFTLEVYFTGLGVGVIHEDEDKPGYVTGVDLLLVDTRNMNVDPGMTMAPMDMDPGMEMDPDPTVNADPVMVSPQHLPRLYFEVEDMAEVADPPTVEIPGITTTGMPLVMLDLTGQDIRINVTGNDQGPFGMETAVLNATMPGDGAPDDAVNWIPDLKGDLGITDFILPGDSLTGSPYAARVRLPAGRISSERLFFNEDGSLAQFAYGEAPTTRVLADQFVWTRKEVSSVEIVGLATVFPLDALLKQMRKQDPTVRISVTCVPGRLVSASRFRRPDHFHMFQMVSLDKIIPQTVKPVGGGPVCSGVACPPPKWTGTT